MRFLTPVVLAQSTRDIAQAIRTGQTPALAHGLCEGYKVALISALAAQDAENAAAPCPPLLIVAANDMAAARLVEDLVALLGNEAIALLPARPTAFYRMGSESREVACHRLQTLHRARQGGLRALVAPIDALLQGLQPHALFDARTLCLARGARIMPEALCQALDEAGYERGEKVEERGQFAARGGLIDIWPVDDASPVRMEFWDDEIDTLRTFDPETQRSIEMLDELTVSPATEALLDENGASRAIAAIEELLAVQPPVRALGELKSDVLPDLWSMEDETVSPEEDEAAETPQHRRMRLQCQMLLDMLRAGRRFLALERMIPLLFEEVETPLDYLKGAHVVIDEPNRCSERADNLLMEFSEQYTTALERGDALPGQDKLMFGYGEAISRLLKAPLLALQSLMLKPEGLSPRLIIAPKNGAAPACHGKVNILADDIRAALRVRHGVALLAGGYARGERLREALEEFGIEAHCRDDAVPGVGEVVILPAAQTHGFRTDEAALTVFAASEIYGAAQMQRRSGKKRTGAAIESFTDLRVGDAVVHDNHGVGIYKGMSKQELGGAMRDFMLIAYAGGDMLYVPTEQMNRVQKYIGSEDGTPRINRLGGGEWQRAKQKVRASIREMATDLVRLYAERQARKGHAFAPDTPWQRQFEEAFPYEPTADQVASIEEIKADMERTQVMDRLLCGDVGYGKTEVAVRAAFKAVIDAKQVAFLAPTTVLAQQHAQTLRRRFEGFPVSVDVISRFRTPQEQKKIIAQVNKGEIDILVGTHRLLSADIRWKDLGLLIVDEEHRFGVQHKEQLKDMKKTVDVLTLSATPIPRTLHMSMAGIRDMSLLETPPEERYPVQTFVTEYSDGLVRDALLRELGRGGQAYVLYNRVETIDRMHEHLRRLVPEARIAVGHGQMKESMLEDVMLDFFDGKFDVLLCSTIIESGLDVPNANTLVVCESDRFGLAQLYQLRGRVGRSNRLAYAYLTVRPDKILSETAEKRLSAIREYTEFGSGFKIAMRDLEIRGAGNILGAEQHGHMSAVGYDMYVKLMAEMVAEIRGEAGVTPDVETQIEARVDAYLPTGYGGGERTRVEVYKRIARINSPEERGDVIEELIDRFGDVPHPVKNLVDIAYLKGLCQQLYIEKATLTPGLATLRFSAGASLDPTVLMGAITRGEGMALHGTQPPTLLVREQGASPEVLVTRVSARLEALIEAMSAGDGNDVTGS